MSKTIGSMPASVSRVARGVRRVVAPPTRPYIELMDRIHQYVQPRTYVEIGVFRGRSLGRVLPGTRVVGIDPAPQLKYGCPGDLKLFEMTSDDFFEKVDLRAELQGDLDLAFIDGMHHFEFALRDFANIEHNSTADTVVLIHDCYPIDAVTAERERTTGLWSGDIWRLVLCLKDARPDLDVRVVDVEPSGLGIIRGLDPTSTVLFDRHDELVAKYLDVTYDYLDQVGKAEALNRMPNEWPAIVTRLGGSQRRGESRQWLRLRRSLYTSWATPVRIGRETRMLVTRAHS